MARCAAARSTALLDSEGIWPIMVAATAFYLLFFVGYPVVYNVMMSLQEVTVANLRSIDRPWVGLANYERLFADPLFPLVLKNTVVFVGLNVLLQCLGGLAAALFFQQRFPGASFLRGLVLAGWILPPLVIGAVWKWLLASDNGVLELRAAEAAHHLRPDLLAVGPRDLADRDDHGECLVRPAVQHDPDRSRARRHSARHLRGGGARRRGAGAALLRASPCRC